MTKKGDTYEHSNQKKSILYHILRFSQRGQLQEHVAVIRLQYFGNQLDCVTSYLTMGVVIAAWIHRDCNSQELAAYRHPEQWTQFMGIKSQGALS